MYSTAMSPKAAPAAATSGSGNARPTLADQARSSSDDDEFIRTKILLLGLRRYVSMSSATYHGYSRSCFT